jgi:DNA-binding CsgD family transcriptional regulator
MRSSRIVDAAILGRTKELEALSRLVAGSTERQALLELEGAPGVGKTTVWEEGCRLARADGRTVLSARGAGTEVRLGYAGLADLLAEVDEELLMRLPGPQRRAIEAALLRGEEEGAPPDPRAVGTGLWSVLEELARAAPLLVAIDDLQWLDPSSADALAFAVRRLSGPVGVLVATRTAEGDVAERRLVLRDATAIERLAVGPLKTAEIERLVRDRTAAPLAAPDLDRIAALAAGNPFIAVELARTLDPGRPDAATELPAGLRELVDARLATVTPEVGEAVLYAAMLTRPDVPTVQRALGEQAATALAAAEAAGILRLDGARVVFSHPLLTTGAYATAPAADRRAAHRRIAAVTSGEERARHLALGSLGPEPEVVAELDAAAAVAFARGASSDAAELLELALRLGADDPERRGQAAAYHLESGNFRRARELWEELVEELPAGPQRALALGGLGTIERLDDDFPGSRPFLERALEESEEGWFRLALALELAFACTQSGSIGEAIPYTDTALAQAEGLGVPDLLAQALAVHAMVHFLVEGELEEAKLERALALEDEAARAPGVLRPSFIGGLIYGWLGRLELAQSLLERVREQYRQRGAEGDFVYMTIHAAGFACARGDVAAAWELVAVTHEHSWRLGSTSSRSVALWNECVVAAWVGEVERARAAGEESMELARRIGSPVGEMFVKGTLGAMELARGDNEAAARATVEAADTALSMGADNPDTLVWAADAVEALAALGQVEEAERLATWQRTRAEAIGRPTGLTVAARCDGLLAAARGDLAAAEELLAEALAAGESQTRPFETARTALVLGGVQRRRRRRAAARASFERAEDLFAELGAALWAERAARERERLDPAATDPELTAAEERTAALAASGLTNREIAAELFVSEKTVEVTLTRVYRKLGLRSRAQLGGWAAGKAGDPRQGKTREIPDAQMLPPS